MNMNIQRLNSDTITNLIPGLARLLQDAVGDGASIGFLPPLSSEEAVHYWQDVAASLQGSHRILLVALVDAEVVGTVQLDMAGMQVTAPKCAN